jgi:hypothetical protein
MTKQLLREPLVHFLTIGTLLFLLFGLTPEPPGEQAKQIMVAEGDVQRLAARFSRTWMRPPTEAELDGLIEGHVREEIYYREALALGLDRDDPMVRQRMRQKLEFLLEDLSDDGAPSDADLRNFLAENAERFSLPPRISFQQVYLNPDKHDDLEAAATAVAEVLDGGGAAETLGDGVMLDYAYESVTPREIARLFGEAFSREVAAFDPDAWHGPVDSGFGRHFVRIIARQAGHLPTLNAVRDRVAAEWSAQHKRERKEASYQRLREGYEVIIEPVEASDSAAPGAQVTGG